MNFIVGNKYKITFEMKGNFDKKTQVVRTYTIEEVRKKEIKLKDRWTPILLENIISAELVIEENE